MGAQTYGGNARKARREEAARRAENRKQQGGETRADAEEVLAEYNATKNENPTPDDVSDALVDANRDFFYPLQGISDAPATITFTAHKIDGIFAMFVHSCCYWKYIGIENDIFLWEINLVH